DARCIAWARKFFNAASPLATGSAYVNFMTADEADRVAAAYAANYARLATIKKQYDPTNLFRVNQNIVPAHSSRPPSRLVQAEPARDDQAHDLARAGVDRLHRGIGVIGGDRVLVHEPVAAEQLQALAGQSLLQLRGPELGHADFLDE